MLILAIETSCDETSAAVVKDGTEILSNVISSQIEFHQKYGGIVPEVAARKHVEVINLVIKEALEKANAGLRDINAVAVTYGPGLVGSLLVGVCAAKAIAYALNVPLIGLNHLEGHIYANFLISNSPISNLSFPFICLLVSGGHTMIVLVKDHGKYEVLGRTRDDAAGEAFDKVARFLGLGYPGGPIIDKLAKEGNLHAIEFKRPMIEKEFGYDFSFSGIKTAVVNLSIHDSQFTIRDIVVSFQQAIVDVLVEKTIRAAKEHNCKTIALAGGVSANSRLREDLLKKGQEQGLAVIIPPLILCTDNAAMIGCAGYYHLKENKIAGLD
ncbi:MAG: tRNA (adenosine(37)-N6)-threonylcarbamoyltransferase complex transferase subunit TsaD, partial [Candidatus Margulisbacteria bacterium]|nr:tRNA (adenosine(37)-N6)-threonylcarbamoyltransferase complex transferase subunit TsaD [Candidatus Margulisiibacteriota bacterium]